MRLKYYLRGAGIGIILTTLIFVIGNLFSTQKSEMSVAEAIKIAESRGYVLADEKDIDENKKDDVNPENKPAENKPSETKPDENKTTENKTVENKPSEIKPDDNKTQENKPETKSETKPGETSKPTETKPETTSVTYIPFTIKQGENSEAIAKRLKELGVISDYEGFNKRLANKGVDEKIVVGSFYIHSGMGEDELMDLLGSAKNRKTSLSQN